MSKPGPLAGPAEFASRPIRFLALSGLLQQLRQLGDIRRDPPGLILGEQLGGRIGYGFLELP